MKRTRKHPRYKDVAGEKWIEVRVKDPERLFDQRDPAPFREKDLDDNFVEYIFSSLKEFSVSTPFKIVIYIEAAESKTLSKASIREAIRSYFIYKTELKSNELRRHWKRAQVFLLIGVLALVACIGSAQMIIVPPQLSLSSVFREGLVILGWVSVWKPIEVILFDWYPIFEDLRYYKKLVEADFQIHFGDKNHAY